MSAAAAPSSEGVSLLSPASLPRVLGEALMPGVRVVALLNRSGLLLGCAGDAATAPSISAICSSLWLNHEKCDGHGYGEGPLHLTGKKMLPVLEGPGVPVAEG